MRTGLLCAAVVACAAASSVAAAPASVGVRAGHPAAAHVHGSTTSTLIDGTTDTVVNIDPANEYDYGSETLDLPLFQGLYGFPHGAKLEPVLATGCTPKKRDTVWFCTLRKGVEFSDGSSFSSADVKWTFDRVLKIHGDQGIWALLSNLKSVSTSGPNAVTFVLKSPQATWPFILASNAGYVVPKSLYPFDSIRTNTESQVGTGPYMLTKYVPGQEAVLETNPHYWGPAPKTKQVIITYYSSSTAMKLALQQGTIDMAFDSFTSTELKSLSHEPDVLVHEGTGIVIRYLAFNVTRPPTDNLAIRRAIAYLMPRQTIASRVYGDQVAPLYSQVPAGLPGHIDAFASAYGRSPSVAKAKSVLAKAHVRTPIPLDVWWTPTHYGDSSAEEMTEVQRALNASGLFHITLKSAEWAAYRSSLGKTYDAFQLGGFPDYPDGEDYIVPYFQPNNFMSSGYSSVHMNQLIKAEYAAPSTKARLAIIRSAQRLIANQALVIPYFQQKMIAVSRRDVHGLNDTLDPALEMRFWLISKS